MFSKCSIFLAVMAALIVTCLGCDSKSAKSHLEKAKQAEQKQRYTSAKDGYEYIIKQHSKSKEAAEAEELLRQVNAKITELEATRKADAEARKEADRSKRTEHDTKGKELANQIESRYDEMEDITRYYAKGCKRFRVWDTNDKGEYDNTADGNDSASCAVYAYIGKRKNNIWVKLYCGVKSRNALLLKKLVFLRNDQDRAQIFIGPDDRERNVLSDGTVMEWASLYVDKILSGNLLEIGTAKVLDEDLLAIGSADKVKVRFSGSSSSEDFILTPKERRDLLLIREYAAWLRQEQRYVSSDRQK